ncbi:MAG: efflux RND transporter periplasmic adaptor subunit [Nitratireductor sp.]|jgi:Cu(I)/Ag(I) efflux system membrane fusion protein|nr:efflux RND transporter periplasmic adaptor subunit [Nitratireductor sp.]
MNRKSRTGLTLAAILAAGAGGFWAGHRDFALPSVGLAPSWLRAMPWLESAASIPANASPVALGPVIYYRDPDGRPAYSATPKTSENGREFVPVYASEDISFDNKPASITKSTAASEPKRILYYRNPMGLPDTSPVPKKDSMGMDYLPVYAGEDEDASIVKVAPGKLQRTGVRSEVVSDRAIVRQVRVPGTVQLDERRISVVATRSDAFIDKVENVTTGDRVRQGQPLLELYSPDINSAAAQLISNPGFEGSRRRLQNLNVQDDVIAEMERTRKVPHSIRWSAPRDGFVLERNVVAGMKAAAGDVLFRIADISVMWVLADVPEYDLGTIRLGQNVTIRVRSFPGRTFAGRVNLIYPQVNKQARTTKVRIEIANPDGVLRPDMYADVEIAAGTSNPVVAVPDSAVIDTGTRKIVILDIGEGRFKPREVATGAQGGGFTEISQGILSGDRVVVAANFLIDAESNLKAALSGMAAAESTP